MITRFFCLLTLHLLVVSCNLKTLSTNESQDFILIEKDLIPEGTAFNEKTKTVYIGSIYRQKIIGIDAKGEITDIIDASHFGDLSPIGMEMEEQTNTLWINVALAPIVNQSKGEEWRTGILAFDMSNQRVKNRYEMQFKEQAFLNDLTVTEDGTVYATESVNGDLYKIDPESNQLDHYLKLEGYSFPNGITYYQPLHCLFVATNEGILKIDLNTNKINLLEVANNINANVIDGLAIHNNYLIGHQSSKISKFYLNENFSKITSIEIFDTGDEFDSSTTGEIGGKFYHYIVNSQIKSGINQAEKTIRPLDSLEQVIIRKKRLKS